MARIEFVRVSKHFPKQPQPAVQDLSLAAEDGEFLVVLGPSGCGKTTALRMLAGLEDPDSGDIRIAGKSVVDLEPRDRDIALVFQQYALYPHLNARDNILYPLKVQGLSSAEKTSRLERATKVLGIPKLLDRKPGQLSGGEQQRVALGRAIVRQPRAFLMDEPLSNLDAQLRLHMRTELKALQRELGVTTFFVTHDQAEAMTLADRIAVMNAGRMQQIGTPDEVYGEPANHFVAEFLGSPPMNLMPASPEGDTLMVEGGWRLPMPAGSRLTNRAVTVGLRPEAIQLTMGPSQTGYRTEVFLTEPLGSEVIVNVRVGGKLVKVRTAPEVRPQPGEIVSLSPDPAGIRLYDAVTGEAVR